MSQADRWGDLQVRVLSAIVMLVVGSGLIWLGAAPFFALILIACGAMIWELTRVLSPEAPKTALAMGVIAIASLLATLILGGFGGLAILVPSVLFLLISPQLKPQAAIYALVLMAACAALLVLRGHSIAALVWLVAVVVASDVMGYFAGRALGGPKFWPAISPKKTWSGTIAGWIGAALVGLGFWAWGSASWQIILLSPIVAFAGQLGDIAESWFKRRTGVKDSSNLIPGHGGVLDRFDALTFGAVVALAAALWLGVDLPNGF